MTVSDDKAMTDTDFLPPTEYLVMEVLAARTRLGEHDWTFPSRLNGVLEKLAARGLIQWKAATTEHHSLAWLTPLGRASALSPSYSPPAAPSNCIACFHLWSVHGPSGCHAKVYPAHSLNGERCPCSHRPPAMRLS